MALGHRCNFVFFTLSLSLSLFYLTSLVPFINASLKSALNDNRESAASINRTHNWCRVPKSPLRIIASFQPQPKNDHVENNFSRVEPRQGYLYKDTIIFVGCGFGYTVINGSLRYTCTKPNEYTDADWYGTLPACKRNVCWWLGSETRVEFRYNGQLLSEHINGFPEGTQLIFLNWTCPKGLYPNNNLLVCHSSGNWSGSYPTCLTTGESAEAVELKKYTNNFLIWAVIVTIVCVGLGIALIFLSYKLIKRRTKAKSKTQTTSLPNRHENVPRFSTGRWNSRESVALTAQEEYPYSVIGNNPRCNCSQKAAPSAPTLQQADFVKNAKSEYANAPPSVTTESSFYAIPKPKRRPPKPAERTRI